MVVPILLGDVLKQGTKFGYANDLLELGEELGSGAAAKAGEFQG